MWHRRQHPFKIRAAELHTVKFLHTPLTNEHQRGLSKLMAISINVSNFVFIPLSANTSLQVEMNTRVMVLPLDINYLIYLYQRCSDLFQA